MTRAIPLGASLAVVALVVPVTLLAAKGSDKAMPEPSGQQPSLAVDSPDSRWTQVEHDGVHVDLPPGWGLLDTSSCAYQAEDRYGPPGEDPCRPDRNLSFYGSALFDSAYGPGLHRDPASHTWGGYAYAGDRVVWISARDRQTAERVLDSVLTTE